MTNHVFPFASSDHTIGFYRQDESIGVDAPVRVWLGNGYFANRLVFR